MMSPVTPTDLFVIIGKLYVANEFLQTEMANLKQSTPKESVGPKGGETTGAKGDE